MLAETRTAPERTPGVQTARLVKSPDAPWNRGLIKRKFQKVTRAGGGLGVTTEGQHEGPVWHQDALSQLRAGDPRPPVGGAAGSRTHTDWVRARGWGPWPLPRRATAPGTPRHNHVHTARLSSPEGSKRPKRGGGRPACPGLAHWDGTGTEGDNPWPRPHPSQLNSRDGFSIFRKETTSLSNAARPCCRVTC